MPDITTGKGQSQMISHLVCTMMQINRIDLGKMRKFSHIFYNLNEIEIAHQPKT